MECWQEDIILSRVGLLMMMVWNEKGLILFRDHAFGVCVEFRYQEGVGLKVLWRLYN